MAEQYIKVLSKKGYNLMKGQFIFHKENKIFFPEFSQIELGEWLLEIHHTVNIIYLENDALEKIGLILGYAIHYEKRKPIGKINISSLSLLSPTLLIQNLRQKLSGRYLIFFKSKYNEYIIPDPIGSMSVLFSREQQIGGSTIFILEKIGLKRSLSLEKKLKKVKTDIQFPCGISTIEEVEVLLPNHFLDLKVMKPIRIITYLKKTLSENKVINIVKSNIFFQVKQLVQAQKTNFLLTGGEDSRMMLGCIQPLWHDIAFSTFFESTVNNSNLDDLKIASAIAEDLSLQFTTIDLSKGNNPVLGLEYAVILGFGGELSRGFFWKKMNNNQAQIKENDLIEILKLPPIKIFKEKIEKWWEEVNNMKPEIVLDLLYVEHILGCKIAPTIYRYDLTSKFAIVPLCDRQIIDGFLRLDKKTKLEKNFSTILLSTLASKLLKYKFQ